jgi:pimeloyl-ACP methyl ester carboxylesterase
VSVTVWIRKSLAPFAVALVLASCAGIAHRPAASASRSPIHEDGYVVIGGIEQWITIHGDDRANPVVLMLHGGPGDPLSPYADATYGKWQSRFTLVQWDQRGAGRTWGKSGQPPPDKMTIDVFAQDGIEVAEYAIKHLGVKKVILQGGSWGSVLGVYMLKARPDLFTAWLGDAQLVNMGADFGASYRKILAFAREANDAQTLAKLQAIGAPPWHAIRSFGAFNRIARAYEAKRTTPPPDSWTIAPDYAGKDDQANDDAGDDYAFIQFIGMNGDGELPRMDLAALGPRFGAPVYIVQGEEDLKTPPEIAKRWFDTIVAPDKAFVLVPKAGHDPDAATVDAMYSVLTERIAPVAR